METGDDEENVGEEETGEGDAEEEEEECDEGDADEICEDSHGNDVGMDDGEVEDGEDDEEVTPTEPEISDPETNEELWFLVFLCFLLFASNIFWDDNSLWSHNALLSQNPSPGGCWTSWSWQRPYGGRQVNHSSLVVHSIMTRKQNRPKVSSNILRNIFEILEEMQVALAFLVGSPIPPADLGPSSSTLPGSAAPEGR